MDAAYARLHERKVLPVSTAPQTLPAWNQTAAGIRAFYFRDPDNHRLEIYWGIDQIGSDGHVRPPSEWKGARSLADAIADPVRGQDTTLHDSSLIEHDR